eukprot:s1551_g8.t1
MALKLTRPAVISGGATPALKESLRVGGLNMFELFNGHGVGPLVAIENLSDHDAHCAADDLTVVGARTAHCAHQFTADPGELCLKHGQTMGFISLGLQFLHILLRAEADLLVQSLDPTPPSALGKSTIDFRIEGRIRDA